MANSLTEMFSTHTIDKSGNIFSTISNKILKTELSNTGYLQIKVTVKPNVKHFYIHRLMGEEYIPNPLSLKCVNHKDGNKLNNNIENLEWCTYSENSQHSYDKLGRKAAPTGKFSKDCLSSKPVAQYSLIGKLIKEYYSAKDVTVGTNFNRPGISMCANGKKNTHKGFIWKFIIEVKNV